MTGLIAAKLRVPTPLSPLLARPRVQDRLRASVRQSIVVLLVGPSGIGKTAELVRWSTVEPRPVAWLTVDGRDNDPQRLWRHVAAALAVPPDPALAPGSDVYVSAIADRILEQGRRPVLVLDEFEHVVKPELHDQLDLLIRACGDGLTTVIASRVRPSLRLDRLQLAGRLSIMDWSDLRFDRQEAQALLAEVFDVDADPRQVEVIVSATDGWAGGLMLSVRADGHGQTIDYLVDHVWAGLPAEMREFLVDTAVLGRFCPALADAARGRDDSAGLLDRLRADGVFLVAEDGTWVRYQRLFREALVHRLESTDPDRTRALHRRAAEWHAANGSPADAVDHALRAEDYPTAMDVLRTLFDEYYRDGHLVILERWLSTLPDKQIGEHPWLVRPALNLWCAIGRFDERDRWARVAAEPDGGRADVWRLCLARERGDLTLALRQGRAHLRAEAGAIDPLVASQARISVARTLLLAGQRAESRRLLDEIVGLWEDPPAPVRVSLHGIAGLAAYLDGDRAVAVAHAGKVHTALAECQVRPAPRMAPEAVILQAVLSDGAASSSPSPPPPPCGGQGAGPTPHQSLAELVDTPPGFGNDTTMGAFALLLLAGAQGAADRLAMADELLARCPNPMGLTDLRHRVAADLGEPVPDRRSPAESLSEREIELWHYLRTDLTFREIADDLFLSVNTVKTHARNIYRKLGVSSRLELAGPASPARA